ncbi:hypothetical protein ACFQH8_00685 [Halomicroarcula sp. GCM10025710]
MKRRRLLALCGSLLATAGCVSTPAEPRDETGTETPVPPPDSPTDEGTGTRTDFGTVSVESATVQQGVVGPDSPDSIGVYDEAEQYLVVIVAVDGPAPEPERFALKADGDAVNPDTLVDGLYRDGQWAVRYGQGVARSSSRCRRPFQPSPFASSGPVGRGRRPSRFATAWPRDPRLRRLDGRAVAGRARRRPEGIRGRDQRRRSRRSVRPRAEPVGPARGLHAGRAAHRRPGPR